MPSFRATPAKIGALMIVGAAVLLGGGCAGILGIEEVSLDEGAAGAGGVAGMGGTGGVAGMGGTGGVAGMGGAGGVAGMGGTGGQGGGACVPKTCMELQKNCGDVDDGCMGTAHCGECSFGQVCGYGGVANVCGGSLKVRNGFVRSDGKSTSSQTCDVLADGSVDCDETTHPFTSFSLPPATITLDPGTWISDRFGSAFSRGNQQWLLNGFMQSDGAKSWSQLCMLGDGGTIDCDPVAHPYIMETLPPAGASFDAGTTVGGRYTYVYTANGALLMRNGFVQSDGAKVHSQNCEIDAAGQILCDPATHPFTTFTLPPNGITLDANTFVKDRYLFVFGKPGALKVRSGFVQSDGLKSFFQDCDLPATGILACDLAVHPMTTELLPPSSIMLEPGVVLDHRYAFEYVR